MPHVYLSPAARFAGAALFLFALGCGTSLPSDPTAQSSSSPLTTAPRASSDGSAASVAPSQPVARGALFGPLASVALGGANLCVAEADGTVRCVGDWPIPMGDNGVRNQGLRVPVAVERLPIPSVLALTQDRGCAIAARGAVWCWGNTTPRPQGWTGAPQGRLEAEPVDGVDGALELALGWSGSCALVSGGKVRCWGPTFSPSLGKGPVPPPRTLDLQGVTHLSGQKQHACATLQDGTVACWGHDTMADRQRLASGEERVVRVPDLSNVVTVTAGDAHDCALTRDREVVCWGQNGSGQLGDGSFEARERPVKVAGLAGVTQVAAGHGFTCALTEGGGVSCWGDAGNCVVGAARIGCETRTLGSTMGPVEVELCPKPQPITLPFAATSIAVGSGTGCARDVQGHVACWGRSLTHDPGGCAARAL